MPLAPATLLNCAGAGNDAYATGPTLELSFEASTWQLALEDSAADAHVAISFDGVTDHVILRSGGLESVRLVGTWASQVWARRLAGATTVAVRVMGWSLS